MMLALTCVLLALGSLAVTPKANEATPLNANTEGTVRRQKAVSHFQINRSGEVEVSFGHPETSGRAAQRKKETVVKVNTLEINPAGEVLERHHRFEDAQDEAKLDVVENSKMRRSVVNHLQINAAGGMFLTSDVEEEHAEHAEHGKTQKDETYKEESWVHCACEHHTRNDCQSKTKT